MGELSQGITLMFLYSVHKKNYDSGKCLDRVFQYKVLFASGRYIIMLSLGRKEECSRTFNEIFAHFTSIIHNFLGTHSKHSTT